jgi:transcriptional regulator
MYNNPQFKDPNEAAVIDFMQAHPFIIITGVNVAGKPVATQVPVFIDKKEGKILLTGHIQRKSDHHLAFEQNTNVMALFTGPHAYVSASWYSNPHIGSTWNFMSVYAQGTIRFGNDDELAAVMQRLTLHYENGNNTSPTVFENLPADYLEKMTKAIVAFEIEVTNLQHVFKLSQNRDEESYNNIIHQLQKGDADAQQIAMFMENGKAKLFNHA